MFVAGSEVFDFIDASWNIDTDDLDYPVDVTDDNRLYFKSLNNDNGVQLFNFGDYLVDKSYGFFGFYYEY